MYLEGQLPLGPASSNRGGEPTPNGVSALFDGEMAEPMPSPKPEDLSGSTFYTLPDGGPVVVSPSLATEHGIVQYPVNPMRGYRRGDKPPQRNAPPGYTTENPDDWRPATCGLDTPGAPVEVGDNVVPSPCPQYGADGSLVTLRNDAGRNAGLGDCCQSGYQKFETLEIPESPSPWWLLAIAGVALLVGSKGERN